MTDLLLKVVTDRDCSLVPLQIEIDFSDHIETKEKKAFCPSHVRLLDKATCKPVPSQFSPGKISQLKGTLSWIMLNEAQDEFEVEVLPNRSYPCCLERGARIWDRGDGQLEIFLSGGHITSYVFNEAYERPFLYPLIGPNNYPVTRSVPTLGDHPHHKGIGLALGDVSGERGKPGVNFWALGTIGNPKEGRVIHQRFAHLEDGPVYAMIQEENIWKQNDGSDGAKREGRLLMTEKREVTVWNVSPVRIIDIHTVLSPAVDEVILNADVENREMAKENGPLTIRVADNMRGMVQGMIVNSDGGRTEEQCWGRRARWVDYYGPVVPGGPVNGIAAMDHPSNVRHPTGWHVRNYGLFAANPFYDKKPEWPEQGPIYLSKAKREKLDLRYRILVHLGDEKQGKVEEKWQDWVNPPQVKVE